ncbi:C40 family peptidase [Alteribacillus iranensis]|uniref:C40 family peptidase n=1 Tax=Alteribacillus iranensis TaxID=930128 RepID=UPI0011608D3A|nr:C40 family peptidase [Alteribacillus iranensis]
MVKRSLVGVLGLFMLLASFSIQPGVSEAAGKVDEIIAEAKKHMGTPYQWGGTTPGGFDCSGFIQYTFKKAGEELPRTAAEQYGVGKSVSKSDLRKGDLVFFSHGSGIQHNGIYIGNGQFIHSSTSKGVIISQLDDPYYWGDRYVGAKRVIANEDKAQEAVKSQELEPLPEGEYHDVEDDYWAYNSISELADQKIMSGYGDSTFKPSTSITRAEAAAYLTNALDLSHDGSSKDFHDVNGDTEHVEAIQAVNEAGIITGDKDDNFMPEDPLTRQHMAVIFYRAFELNGVTYDKEFIDVSEDHPYAKHIHALAGSGITTGNSNNEFEPRRETTRAHFAVFLERALER